MDKKRVLIFPAGPENALEVYDALRYNVNFEVFGASGRRDFAEYYYDETHYLDGNFYFQEPGFDERLEELIQQHRIDIVIPAHDDIVLYLAQRRERFSAKIAVPAVYTARICRHKRLTYREFEGTSFCPKVFWSEDQIADTDYPLFLKPDAESGSHGTAMIECKDLLEEKFFSEKYVVMEYLPGEELTVDCFTDRKGTLTFAGARRRERVEMGISFRSSTVTLTDELQEVAAHINGTLHPFGGWYFQVRQDANGVYKLLEIANRTATGMTLYRHRGVNFPLLTIFELWGVDTSYVLSDYPLQMERRLMTKYRADIGFDTVYLDFDDTIVLHDQVCDVLIRFMYQCVNRGKRLILLTRHEGELQEVFEKNCICGSMFDEIVHLTFEDEKADYICGQRAIFIDNSFRERKAVAEKCGIPVFDVDAVDLLLE